MVFQEPMTSLNPGLHGRRADREVLRLHEGLGRRAALARAAEMLKLVHISHPNGASTITRTSSPAACASA
jgi:peptide/nickel transport system ATP-binding protein